MADVHALTDRSGSLFRPPPPYSAQEPELETSSIILFRPQQKNAPQISRNAYFGKPARWGATVLLKLLPLLASQFVDQSIAPRNVGYLATGW